MRHIERTYLKNGSTVSLLSASDAKETATYRICNVEAEDGYTVCYQAEKDGNMGKLIELYPLDSPDAVIPDFFHMNRHRCGKLKTISNAMEYRFSKIKERFCHFYHLLSEQAEKSCPCNESFYNFVPPYQLYYWGPAAQNASHNRAANAGELPWTAYLWMQGTEKKRCLEDYIKDLQKAPGKTALQKAAGIISAVISITECIEHMHCAGLLHLNICPSNFAIDYDENFQVGQGHISMNIASAFFAPGNEYPISIGTGMYMAPEIGILPPDNRADIYSIGMMLHHAFTSQASGILNMEADTKHIFASHMNKILYRCLPARREDRYASCEELLSDLRLAFAYVR